MIATTMAYTDEGVDTPTERTGEEGTSEGEIVNDAPKIYTVNTDFAVGLSDNVEDFVLQPNGLFMLENTTLSDDAEGAGY
ncbi:hypothetical protein HUG15_04400 [Salicibibacter cibarius]|uniref:Uncharacterized protein n=1 Tax=Salicibibacter cibarius TaxID=2743000 RepID=A0A7T6Z131_9BACI|nr:hypothetical protein [Salicibibacter cibarius]QQK74917.1 hypothetical protein HUG15_04400 [Salicibibacter cibarius]